MRDVPQKFPPKKLLSFQLLDLFGTVLLPAHHFLADIPKDIGVQIDALERLFLTVFECTDRLIDQLDLSINEDLQ